MKEFIKDKNKLENNFIKEVWKKWY